jgi:hypothetical protein
MKYSGRVQRLNADRLGARSKKPVRPFFAKKGADKGEIVL